MLVSTLNQLGLDGTFFVQFMIAIIGLPLVSFVLVRPLFNQFISRDSVTTGFRKKAEGLLSESTEMEKNYFSKIGDAQKSAKLRMDSIVAKATDENRSAITKARMEAAEKIEQLRQKGERELATVRTQLKSDTRGLVENIVERLL